MASLKQIAAEVGVSYTVVSKVLSGRLGKTRVSKATHAAIIKKAAELNYTPNRLAVALKAGRKGAVGIFLHHFGNAGSDVVDRMLRGISRGLEQSGLRMWLRFFNTDEEFFLACDSKLNSEVDGLIVAGPYHPGMMPKLRDLIRTGTPVVSITNDIPATPAKALSNVSVNYEAQGLLPTRHLFHQGCRKLACVAANPDRTAGFKRAHKEARIPLDPRLVIAAEDYSLQSGERSVKKLLRMGHEFDGIVCHSDAQAFAAINELVRHGLKVPKDVKVTGVDNSPLAELCLVPITSATSEMQRAGQAAVDTLLQKINGQSAQPIVLEPSLYLRQSSRAVGLKDKDKT